MRTRPEELTSLHVQLAEIHGSPCRGWLEEPDLRLVSIVVGPIGALLDYALSIFSDSAHAAR